MNWKRDLNNSVIKTALAIYQIHLCVKNENSRMPILQHLDGCARSTSATKAADPGLIMGTILRASR